MKVLVTGATGFIGSHLVPRLVAEGHAVRALARASARADALDSSGVEVVRGDVRNPGDVDRAVRDCQVVFHLAVARANRPVDVGGTANVARAARQAGVGRIVFTSSTRVYGLARHDRIDEGTPLTLDSRHGRLKAEAERLLMEHGVPVVIARLPLVLGPGGRTWRGVIAAIASGRYQLIGPGTNHFHPVDVADVAEGLLRCGTVKGIERRIYILAGRESRSLRDINATLARLVGGRTSPSAIPLVAARAYAALNRLVTACGGPDLPQYYRAQLCLQDSRFDIARARDELGYAPRISLDEMLARAVSGAPIA